MRPLNRYVLTDEIYILLKNQIINHELPPGEKVNIDQLARDLEVSNIPIREALSRLAAEGLIRSVPFKGMFVTSLTLKELDEIYELRIELESYAVKKAIQQIPEQVLLKLEGLIADCKVQSSTHSENKLQLIERMNIEVHGHILQYCGNETLSKLVNTYIERIQRYVGIIDQDLTVEYVEKECNEHLDIVKSLLARDSIAAIQMIRSHLTASYTRTREYIK